LVIIINICIVKDIKAFSQDEIIITFFPDNIKRSSSLEQVCLNKETFNFKLNEKSNVKIHLYKSLKLFAYCEYVPKNEIKWHTFHLINNKQKKNTHVNNNIDLIKLRLKTEIKNMLCSLKDSPKKRLYKSGNHSKKLSNLNSSKNIKVNKTENSNNENSRSKFRKHSQQLINIPKIIRRRNLLDTKSFNNHSMEIQTLSINKDKQTINDLMLNRSARHFNKSYSVNDSGYNQKRHVQKTKVNTKNIHKVVSYERKSIENTNTTKQIKCKQKSSNFRLEKKHKQILPFNSDNKIHHMNSHSNTNILNNFKEQIHYDLISSYKNILEQTSTINTINNNNDKSYNIQQANTLLNEIALSDNDNSPNHSHSLLSLSQIKSKFEETKNDYNLIYTDTYFESVQDEALKLEMQLLLEKVIELQQLYHNEISQAIDEYKQLKVSLYKYTKMYLLLKRKFNMLEEQIELDKVTNMSQNIYKDIKWVSLYKKEMDCYSFVYCSGKNKIHSLIKKELLKLFMLIVTKNKTKLNNLQKKYIEDIKNKKECINNNTTSLSNINLNSPCFSRRSVDMFSLKNYP
jgi:hypothetical protein